MAHIHLEDGAFSPFWVIVWSLVAAGLVTLALIIIGRKETSPRKLAIAAMCTSVGFAVFQVSIPIFGGIHLNLTPLIGILAGPGLGSLAALLINVFSAAVGHGGWGMIGANTVVNVIEVVVSYYIYRLVRTRFKLDRFASGLGAAVVALSLSAVAIVAIVAVSGIQDSEQTKEEIVANMVVIAVINIAVGVLEGVVTGYVVSFIGRVRPDLLKDTEGELEKDAAPAPGA
ncbi:MAG: cobalt/nickel transport system permease protein [Candidatus Thermoplasmatota archaeon]|nr:cobalt/nickel transport system permease protein [Candidatus Thermoplasmatota archaeon]